MVYDIYTIEAWTEGYFEFVTRIIDDEVLAIGLCHRFEYILGVPTMIRRGPKLKGE